MEELDFIIETTKELMDESVKYLEKELLNIRAGKANPNMLSSIKVEYYGVLTPLNQISNINTPDSQTISIQPWEKDKLPDMEKAIIDSNLGFNPMNNGESILINIPPLTQERRMELVKLAKSQSENTKVSIRNSRKDANNEIRKSEFSEDVRGNYELDIQEITDTYVKKVDNIFSSKEAEILKV
ncbi:MAG: ribosome recycling factor [Flavobacteriaceae bacterium]|nr:ribosome recycling factor [Flavobacteriaceae bacterium]